MNNKNIDNWALVKLKDVILIINPGFPSGIYNINKIGVPHLRPMNISSNGELDLSVIKYVDKTDYSKLQQNDILFNNTNSPDLLGKTTIIKTKMDLAFSNHMTRI